MPAPTSLVDTSGHNNHGIITPLVESNTIFLHPFNNNTSINDISPHANNMVLGNSHLAPTGLRMDYSDLVNGKRFLLSWEAISGAIHYEVQIADDSGFSSLISQWNPKVVLNNRVGVSTYEIVPKNNLYVRVRALDSTSTLTDWSNTLHITSTMKTGGINTTEQAQFIYGFPFAIENEIIDDSHNHYNMTLNNITFNSTFDMIMRNNVSTSIPNYGTLTNQVFTTTFNPDQMAFYIRLKWNGQSSVENVIFDHWNNFPDQFKFAVNSAKQFYIQRIGGSHIFSTAPVNEVNFTDGLEHNICLNYDGNSFECYYDNMTTPIGTYSTGATQDDTTGTNMFIGTGINSSGVPLINTSINADVKLIRISEHYNDSTERNAFLTYPNRTAII